jgi:hypothetical protein
MEALLLLIITVDFLRTYYIPDITALLSPNEGSCLTILDTRALSSLQYGYGDARCYFPPESLSFLYPCAYLYS